MTRSLFCREEKEMKKLLVCGALLALAGTAWGAGALSDFEDLPLAAESYWNGSDLSGGFTSGLGWYPNNYNPTYFSWDSFAYSNRTDTTASGWFGEGTAMAGSGAEGSANYAVAYVNTWGAPPVVELGFAGGLTLDGAYFTNNGWAYWSMMDGDQFSKKFGGADGNAPDWFLLTITGYDTNGDPTGTVDFYLADYRDANNANDYLVTDWAWVDLTSLGRVGSLSFSLSSSDVGEYGMNTPAYFAMDTVIPEPAGLALLAAGGLAALRRRRRR